MLVVVLFFVILLLQLIQFSLLFFILYRLTQDKNSAVTFCKSVWFQLQQDFLNASLNFTGTDVQNKKLAE
jgi:hypothetical protein